MPLCEDVMNQRRFHSYGPVDCSQHFCVPREELVRQCTEYLIGNPETGGHYFTLWAPRQTGKTWLMRQVKKEIETRYGSRFLIVCLSVQGIIMETDDSDEVLFRQLPRIIRDGFDTEPDPPKTWDDWIDWFVVGKGLFDKPLILFIDEFDSLPPKMIDRMITLFRDMYLKRGRFVLHGLALIGVRAVLGLDSQRGSPFNIQRSLHVPNFSKEEVEDLFAQYHRESGQNIAPEVVKRVYETTRGQPGLVCWFGELLTEKYNPGDGYAIDTGVWEDVYEAASRKEWNNTLLNLVKKARGQYAGYVLELFTKSDMPFSIRSEWCSYLYLNGIIDENIIKNESGKKSYVCRFASPFVQNCLYDAMTDDLIGGRLPIPALDPLDDLSDVFEGSEMNLPALLERYKAYLKRLKAKGLNPWKDQPRRSDMHLTEYVGHFHLYFWLRNTVDRRCVISPEFPTGNGRVDLHLKYGDKRGIIEVKSFRDLSEMRNSKTQASRYAAKLAIDSVTIALFVQTDDEDVLKRLSEQTVIDGVNVIVSAIGWI